MMEVEYYRRLAEGAVGRTVSSVSVPDPHCLGGLLTARGLGAALHRATVGAARRHGKLLVLDTSGPSLGIRFGMTGTLALDGHLAIERLRDGPAAEGRWLRLRLRFADGGELAFHDPRRLGRVVLGPDESALGPDAFDISGAQLRAALATADHRAGAPLKARLLDQSKVAGIGNLLADEVLWRAALAPMRPSGSLGDADLRRLLRHLRATLADLLDRGGSHTGDLMPERHPGGRCPRDGHELERAVVGGRTTWWCPAHQR